MQCTMSALRHTLPRFKQKFTHQMALRVTESLYSAVEEVAEIENRRPNEVARFLLERGLEAYIEDGKLYETLEPNYQKIKEKLNG